ncbi:MULTISPECIES: SOS response-associated peptidase [Natrialbaceae]|uniref:SOS response-associated peptidase n=1 Tax=Natrialbaceae TaxID=1644061 RepID=UPI00207C755D|nr:SOS response-associated peptidase [Natronococcus sp. CG52]
MCGRNSVFITEADLEERFDARVTIDDYRPRFNVAPQQPHPVISNEDPDEITEYRWGLVPQWMDDPSEGFINARSETAHEKPAFRHAWKTRPCLVLSTGFYEWKQPNGSPKQPYRVYREDDPAFAMAGLWEEREREDGETLRTVTILTTEPSETVEPIHDRMPVVLPRNDERMWLEADSEERRELCRPYPADDLEAYPISTRVNDPTNDDARVIEPLGNEQSDLGEFA